MNQGFVIDTRRCIGCHACSTACKSENQVPLGVHRTWVKYTEVGRFPDVRRNFQVTRCNHCANPPCVRICPVTAMYQRTDGIVEFDSDVCIGCKACLQACPYDAIYVDPDSGTAAKCHFCGHRVDQGMEPACVVVCPTHAIIAGDLDDPLSEIARTLAANSVTVRKPEQGTAPKLFYIEGNALSMHPTAAPEIGPTMAFSEGKAPEHDGPLHRVHLRLDDGHAHSGTPIRVPDTQGSPSGGPITVGSGRLAGQMVQVAYNVHHELPWHWQVPAYLITKGIGTGAFLFLALGVFLGELPFPAAAMLAGHGLLATLLTTALLVGDLERPARFLRIVFRPQWKSWLARGAFLLIGFSMVATLWFGLEVSVPLGLVDGATLTSLRPALAIVTIPLAIGTAIYTAFLFAQCEGRDLWQNPTLPIHLFVEALVLGGASASLVSVFTDLGALEGLVRPLFALALIIHLLLVLVDEVGGSHATEVATRAAHAITRGKYRYAFWVGGIIVGHVLPLVLLLPGVAFLGALAALLTIGGLFLAQHAFVMAPQEIPNS